MGRRTNWAAVDTGCQNGDKNASIKTRIARQSRPGTRPVIQLHIVSLKTIEFHIKRWTLSVISVRLKFPGESLAERNVQSGTVAQYAGANHR